MTPCNPVDRRPLGSSIHGVFSGKNTGVGFHALLQGGDLPNPGTEPASPVSPAPPVHALHAEPSGNISGCHLLIPASLLHGVATCCVCAGSLAA